MFYKLVLMEILYLGLTWPLLQFSLASCCISKTHIARYARLCNTTICFAINVKSAQANLQNTPKIFCHYLISVTPNNHHYGKYAFIELWAFLCP